MELEVKKPWMSKTLWANAIVAMMAFMPSVAEKVSAEHVMMALGAVNIVLRLITKDKISLS